MRTYVVFPILLVIQSGCTTYFDDDFEADPIGQPPLQEPAGEPEGDFLISHGVTISASSPLAGSKSAALGGRSQMTMFSTAVPASRRDEPLYISWRTSLDPGSGSIVRIRFQPNSALVIAMVHDEIFVNGKKIGFYLSPGRQWFHLAVYPEENQYRLTVTGDAEVGTVTGYSSGIPDPLVEITAEVTQGAASDGFKVDSFHVYQRDGW
jgi:hypothetical protein